MQIIRLLVPLFLGLFVATSANSGETPALRVTAPNGKSSILIGTMHVALEGLSQPDTAAFDTVEHFVVEHASNPVPGDSVPAYATNRPAWSSTLSPRELLNYIQRARCLEIDPEIAMSHLYRASGQIANQVAYTVCNQPKDLLSRDKLLEKYAEKRHLPVSYLEDDSAVEHKRQLITTLTDNGFQWILNHDPKIVLADTCDALDRGDYAKLKDLFIESFNNPEHVDEFIAVMVDWRNAEWMPRLSRYVTAGNALIVVGAMHLPGDRGLINLLRKEGFQVDSLMLPSKNQEFTAGGNAGQ